MKSKLGTWSTGGKSADAGGAPIRPGKVGKVMKEFKSGELKSSSGQKVKKKKQAMAIAVSEAGMSKLKSNKKRRSLK